MTRLLCKYYVQVCCHTFDGIRYLEDLQQGIVRILASSGFAAVTARAVTNEVNSMVRKDLPVELEVLADGEKDALKRETEKALLAVSRKYHLSVMVFSSSIAEV